MSVQNHSMPYAPDMMTLVVNTRCNQRCVYCPPMGEAYAGDSGEASLAEIWIAARAALNHGITTFRVSGGEPLLHSQFDGIIRIMRLLREQGATVHLNTNAVSLHRHLDELRKGAVSSLRISLDSTRPIKYQQITKTKVYSTVKDNVLAARNAGIGVDLIMVLMRHNLDEVLSMVEFCIGNNLNLKISDLEPHDFDGQRFFEDQYVSPDKATKLIEAHYPNHSKQMVAARAGIQMWDILIANTRIRIKDTNGKKCFSELCRSQCAMYPCPEGIYSFLLKPTGKLTWCKRNESIGIDVRGNDPDKLIKTCSNSLQDVRRITVGSGLASAEASVHLPFNFQGLQPSFGRNRLASRKRTVPAKLNRPVCINEYSERWPLAFQQEKVRLTHVFQSHDVRIEHIGSTAIPGMPAKPVIDIGIAVPSGSYIPSILAKLKQMGYFHVPELKHSLPNRDFLWKGNQDHHSYHIFVMEGASDDWRDLLTIRGLLLSQPELATEYATAKREAAYICGNDISTYVDIKQPYYQKLLSLAN